MFWLVKSDFSKHPVWVYYACKHIENAVACLKKLNPSHVTLTAENDNYFVFLFVQSSGIEEIVPIK